LDRSTAALSDRYRSERERGAGGMPMVYLAADLICVALLDAGQGEQSV